MRCLFFFLLLALWPGLVCAEATASFQAATWDKAITLPPFGYRAPKPVELSGGFTVTTQPGTLIEGVTFRGVKDPQQWEIQGTQMRRVYIAGQLGVGMHATDSVFEDCEMGKNSGWFVDWWGTHWKFENCIFTRRFLRNDLPPNDYSIHVTRCTFYGVKLPAIGFKENPATYLQKENMVFENCRFVDCDVPESFLAATVECVFEHCHFAPKGQVKWPPETGSIQVKAYFAGLDEGPAPFLDGPLGVQFVPAPKNFAAGSTLPHTQSGGRVTLATLHLSGESVALGTSPKKASEIVELASSTPARSTAATPNPSAPAAPGSEVHGLDQTLQALPANINLFAGGQPDVAGVGAANAWLARNCVGRPMAMRLTLDGTQAATEKGYAYQANGRPQGVLYHGDTIASRVVALFRPSAAATLGTVQHGADFNVRGVVLRAEVTGRGSGLAYTLTVGDAQVGGPAGSPPGVNSPGR